MMTILKQREYWENKLSGSMAGTRLCFREEKGDCAGENRQAVDISFSASLSASLLKLARQSDLSLYIILLALLKLLIFRYTGSEDITVISPVYRPHVSNETKNDRVLIRQRLNGNYSFRELILQVRQSLLEAYENQDYPFEQLNEYLDMSPGTGDLNRVSPIWCLLRNIHGDEGIGQIADRLVFVFERETKRVTGKILFQPGIYREYDLRQISTHFSRLLDIFVQDVNKSIAAVSFLSPQEMRQLLVDFNNTGSEYPADRLIFELFEAAAAGFADHIAVVRKDGQFSYRQLNGMSNRLARLLRATGVKAGSIAALKVGSSIEMIGGILAVLKAGGGYLPLDPSYPQNRISFMLEDSGASPLLTGEEIGRGFSVEGDGDGNLKKVNRPGDLAYVIYTSGSTGRPRGVMVEHRNLTAYVTAFLQKVEITSGDIVIQQASFSFDAFVEEVYPPLLQGGRIVLPERYEVLDVRLLADCIARGNITMIDCSPLLLNGLNQSGRLAGLGHLRTFISGGDVLKREYIDNLLRVGKVYNSYGPTETTVCVTFFECSEGDESAVPIGKPLSNYRALILDGDGRLLPVGVAGELCVCGAGVSRGYLNRVELSREKFSGISFFPAERMYRTGDLAMWSADGNIRFLGRIDQQVKIRGHRLELGEIERTLLRDRDIRKAVAVTRESESGGNHICAYFESDVEKSVAELRRFLSLELPDYMMPARFVRLAEIPLTSSGKIDRQSLSRMDEESVTLGREYAVPRSVLEWRMVEMWEKLLKRERIGIDDNFFELGGDSLSAIQLIAGMREELGVEFPLRDFFEQPFIRSLAVEVDGRGGEVIQIKPVPRDDRIPLSFAQERLWFLLQLDRENVAYHVPRAIRLKGTVEVSLFERTITEIIKRHEILRTVFPVVDGQPEQRIGPPYSLKIAVVNLSGLESEKQSEAVSKLIMAEGQRGFDFEKGPLIRVKLLKLKENEHVLILTEHHLVHDGWTQGVLLREFIQIYTALRQGQPSPLSEPPFQYADYAIWQRNYFQGEVLKRQLDYWEQKLTGLPPLLELPTDYPRPPMMSGRGVAQRIVLPRQLAERLAGLSREKGVTLFMAMLTVFKILLFRYSGIEDLCVGTGIANRRHKEIEGMLGMVINTLPLRTQISGDMTILEYLEEVKSTCLQAYEYEETPFGKVVEVLRPERSLSYMPLVQSVFSFMDTPTENLSLPGLEIRVEGSHNRSAKFDIHIVVIPPREGEMLEGEILVDWEYNTDIFTETTMAQMQRHYRRLLEAVLTHGDLRIARLPMLEEAERTRLLYEFNITKSVYPVEKTIHELFEDQVRRTPANVALVGKSSGHNGRRGMPHLSYREIDKRVNRFARHLRESGVEADDIVALMVKRSIEIPITILSVLKSGGAYLPIDPDYPPERIRYMLADSDSRLLLVSPGVATQFDFKGSVINIDVDGGLRGGGAVLNSINTPRDTAYIIYTSGSTGRPKGVMIQHSSAINLVFSQKRAFNIDETDRVLQFASYTFDASVEQIFMAFFSGAGLMMIDRETLLAETEFLDYLSKQSITHIHAVPSFLVQTDFCEDHNFRRVVSGGDVCPIPLARKWHKKCDFYNKYGPTETTVTSIEFAVKDIDESWPSLPIGRPIDNTAVFILDRWLTPVAGGVKGELYIGGDGVARGYLNRPDLTAEKFLKSPFEPGERIYRTGDLGRWRREGNIEFSGRIDLQVKVRGFRLELGEIESQLLKHKQIKEAFVVLRDDRDIGKYLVAYFISRAEVSIPDLKEFLSNDLPDYMIPAYFMQLEKFPLNATGKMDRQALPEPGSVEAVDRYQAPRDEVERRLVEIWKEVLNIDKIGIKDNFFMLGGQSLLAMKLIAMINKSFAEKIQIIDLFRVGNIEGIAEIIKGQRSVERSYSFSSLKLEKKQRRPKEV